MVYLNKVLNALHTKLVKSLGPENPHSLESFTPSRHARPRPSMGHLVSTVSRSVSGKLSACSFLPARL